MLQFMAMAPESKQNVLEGKMQNNDLNFYNTIVKNPSIIMDVFLITMLGCTGYYYFFGELED